MRDWTKKVRLTLDLDPAENAELERVVALLKTRTKARLLRKALKFYIMLADHKQKGYLIQAIKGGSLLQFPELDVPYPQEIQLKKRL